MYLNNTSPIPSSSEMHIPYQSCSQQAVQPDEVSAKCQLPQRSATKSPHWSSDRPFKKLLCKFSFKIGMQLRTDGYVITNACGSGRELLCSHVKALGWGVVNLVFRRFTFLFSKNQYSNWLLFFSPYPLKGTQEGLSPLFLSPSTTSPLDL